MNWIFLSALINTHSPISVDKCQLSDYWVPKGGRREVPAEYKDAVLEKLASGWNGSYWVRVVIENGKASSAELVSSDPGGPSDAVKVNAMRAFLIYQPAKGNPSGQAVEVVLTAGPAGKAEQAACAAKTK